MKKLFKTLSLAIAGVILLSGCGGIKNEKNAAENNTRSEYAISDKPVELSLFMVRGDSKYQEDLDVWKEIEKLTNVRLKSVSSKSISDTEQAFNTMMASGNLPDLVMYGNGKEAFSKYGMEGAFASLEELAEENAPNIKAQFDRPVVKAYVTAADGHIYYVPGINPPTVAAGWFIRQDWLDKLGLPVPTDVAQYYNALKAFRENDPNGNGKKDETPYFSRFNGLSDLLGLWDTSNTWNQENGKVYYAPVTQKFKTAFTNIAKWYKEDLIDKEIFTRGGKSRDKLLGDNVGGSTHDWFGSTAQFNNMLKETVPGINFVAFAPPNGKEYSVRDEVIAQGGAISAKSNKKVEAIKFMDFIYSEKGSKFMNFGIEGKHYDMVDGKPTFQDWVVNGDKTAINILQESGACSAFPYIQDFWYEEQWLTPIAKKGVKLYLDNNYLVSKFPTLSYTVEEKTKLNEIMTAIETHMNETTQKWVFGTENVEENYDRFVEQIYSMRLKEAEEIQQNAYDRYIAAQ